MTSIVSLIGYRGTGKSTVAPNLAQRLKWNWLDTDIEIEKAAGCSIAEIFRRSGEAHFRTAERECIQEQLRSRTNLVLSLGGGAIIDDTTRAAIKVAGPVVWLRASVDNILKRLQADAATLDRRPRLTDADDERAEIARVLASRTPLYADAASIIVDTDELDCELVTETVYTHVAAALSGDGP